VPFDRATSPYVVANRQRVSRSGDTLTEPLLLSRNPIEAREAATKAYADIHTGGATFGATIIPSVIGSWYTHNAPGAPVLDGSGTDFGDWSFMVPMFVGRTATWSSLSVNNGGGVFARIQSAVWSLHPTTLLADEVLFMGPLDSVIADPYAVTLGANGLQTTSDWIGLAVHGHGTGGGWMTFDVDRVTAGTGQYNFLQWGHDATLVNGAGASVLATVVGGDGGLMPTDPALWRPYDYDMPSIAIRLLSIP